jgi:tetratricopeptide (TPR) repeat protein
MHEAMLTQAECISQNCIVKNTAYAISQGPKIKTLSQKIINTDPNYGAAVYINNSQNIFTPAPFCNYKEGLECLNELITNEKYRMDKVDYYYAYSAIAYVYIQEKDLEKARYYLDKALELYPENQYLLNLLP